MVDKILYEEQFTATCNKCGFKLTIMSGLKKDKTVKFPVTYCSKAINWTVECDGKFIIDKKKYIQYTIDGKNKTERLINGIN